MNQKLFFSFTNNLLKTTIQRIIIEFKYGLNSLLQTIVLLLGLWFLFGLIQNNIAYAMEEENILDLGNEIITRLPYDQSVLNSISDLIEDEPILRISNEKLGIAHNITVGDLFNCLSYGTIGLISWRIGRSAAEQIININKDAIISILTKSDQSSIKPSLLKSISGPQLGIKLGITGLTSLWLGSIKYYFDSKRLEIKHRMRLDILEKFNIKLDNNPSILDFEDKFRKDFLECKKSEDCSKVFNEIFKYINEIDKNNLLKFETEKGYVYIEKRLVNDSNIEECINKIENELEINNAIYESSDNSSLSIDSPFENLLNLSDPYIGIMLIVILTILLTMYLYTIVIINLMNPQFLKINTDRFKNKYIIFWLKSIEQLKENSLRALVLMVYICLISVLCFMLMLIDLYPSS